jgi:nicotinamide-nucleotide amidase
MMHLDLMIQQLQDILIQNNETITCAESCTGGQIASKITSISGSSSVFKGSIVTYCNEIKEQELGVKKQTMIDHGAVSIQTVQEMLEGVLKKFDANYAIAVSGVAGPNGGTKDKPVGTVVIGVLSSFGRKKIEIYHFEGGRHEVQQQAVEQSFSLIFEILRKNS